MQALQNAWAPESFVVLKFWKGELVVLIHCQGHFSYAWTLIFCKVAKPDFDRGTGCSYWQWTTMWRAQFPFFLLHNSWPAVKKKKSLQWLCSLSVTDCLENSFPHMCILRDSALIFFLWINSHEEWRWSTGKQMVGISYERTPLGVRIFHLDSSKPLITLNALGESFVFDK